MSRSVSIVTTNSPIDPGQTLEVQVQLVNNTIATWTTDVELRIDGVTEDTISDVDVPPEGGMTFEDLEWNTGTGDGGGYEAVAWTNQDTDSTNIVVGEPEFEITNFIYDDPQDWSDGSGTFNGNITVENVGDGTGEWTLWVDGNEDPTISTELDPNEDVSYPFVTPWADVPSQPGTETHTFEIHNELSGLFDDSYDATVEWDEPPEPPDLYVTILDLDNPTTGGEDMTVDYRVTNDGGESETVDVALYSDDGADKEIRDVDTNVTVDADDYVEGTLTWSTDEWDDLDSPYDVIVEIEDDDDFWWPASIHSDGDFEPQGAIQTDERTFDEDLAWSSESDWQGAQTAVNVEITEAGSVKLAEAELGDFFDIEITGANDPIEGGETLTVDYSVENIGDQTGEQSIELLTHHPQLSVVDTDVAVELDDGQSDTGSLDWQTDSTDVGTPIVRVRSSDDQHRLPVTVNPPDPPDTNVYFHEDWGDSQLENRGEWADFTHNGEDGVYRPEWEVSESPFAANDQVHLDSGDRVSHEINLNMSETIVWEFTDVEEPDDMMYLQLMAESDNPIGAGEPFDDGFALEIDDDSGAIGQVKLRLIENGEIDGQVLVGDDPSSFPCDVTVTRDSSGEWELFIDGVSEGTHTNSDHDNPEFTSLSAAGGEGSVGEYKVS